MAITKNGVTEYEGAVLGEYEHMWMDGMLDVRATVWDMERHCTREVQTGYYGSDGCNLIGAVKVVVEVAPNIARDIIRTKKREAVKCFCQTVQEYKAGIRKGTKAEVVRGRKVKRGTVLDVFWVGERETWKSRQYEWMHETETIAGAYDAEGNKVWVPVEYLKSLDPLKSPCAAERKKYIEAYIKQNTTAAVRSAARTGHRVVTQ